MPLFEYLLGRDIKRKSVYRKTFLQLFLEYNYYISNNETKKAEEIKKESIKRYSKNPCNFEIINGRFFPKEKIKL